MIQSILTRHPLQKGKAASVRFVFGILCMKDTASNLNMESDSKKKPGRSLKQLQLKSGNQPFQQNTMLLVVNVDKTTNLVQSMNCSVCTKFMDQISSGKGFQQQCLEGGSKQLKHSAALKYAESTSQEKAFDLHLNGLGIGIRQ